MTWLLLPLAAVVFSVVLGWRIGTRRRPAAGRPAPLDELGGPSDLPELGWVLRANKGLGFWLRNQDRGGVVEVVAPRLSEEARATVVARMPGLSGDGQGRSGVERLESGNLVFVAAEDHQAALLMPPRIQTAQAVRDLEALIGVIRSKAIFELLSARSPSAGETVESIAVRLALEVERVLDAEVAVAVRRRPRGAQVIATGRRTDPHIHRVTAVAGSPVDRCVRGEVQSPGVVYDPLGILPWDRRHRERRALLVPIRGSSGPLGALIAWTLNGAEPSGPARAEMDRAVHRSAVLLEDAIPRMELDEQTKRDPLTGLYNRRGLEARMGDISAERGALICVDLDHFKSLNDNLGHPAGDSALGFVARILLETVRENRDTAARIGGEEFAIWLPGAGMDEAAKIAERIRTRIAGRAWGWQGRPWPITASVGVAGWPESTKSRENLIQLADQALYRAKQTGRNRVEIWTKRTGD